jgi:nucleotide-binding universal stress UspA family protein
MNIKKVISPIDFSDNSKLIAESAAYIAGTFKAALHLIFIVQNFEDYSGFFVPQMNMPTLEQELLAGAEERMDRFYSENVDAFKKVGVSEVVQKVFVGDVAEQIVDYTQSIHGDLIIMGTHGYKGLEKIMFGSIADKVVRSAHCPVMTINPYTCCEEEKK